MLKPFFYTILLGMACISVHSGWAQAKPKQDKDKLSPKTYYGYNDYDRALEGYLEIWPTHQGDPEINLHIAVCYLHVNGDKSKALPYLHYLFKRNNQDEEVILMLGQAYMYAYKFDEALKYFNLYRSITLPKNYDKTDLYISYCNNAKELTAHPLNVTFENLGKEINTKYPDYYPFIAENDSALYFTSRRDNNTGGISSFQGFYTSDIYYSRVIGSKFAKARNAGTMLNTPEDEQCVYVTPDGKNMLIYIDNAKLKIADDLFITSTSKGKAFPKPTGFNNPVNTDFSELEGCISKDLGTLIISSDRPGGMGETDLYMLQKADGDKWDKPVNLGPNINTPYSEAFPVYDEATHTLYFASEGPKSMGGFDIFKSAYDQRTNTFGSAINLGYPINTPEDNMVFSLAANKRDGYVSAYRPEGLGNLDIYKVNFCTTLSGKVMLDDSTSQPVITVSVSGSNGTLIETNELKNTGDHYIFTLPSGKYILNVKAPGYPEYIEDITIDDKLGYKADRKKNIVLKHPGTEEQKPATKSPKKHPPTPRK